ncbi:hypothetical protein Vadar_012137 [Vaccinium darrowii]|uniref:Uncharacterized protein n=1 Tax=Vaccinium darrowii TaxID=229202 RepID=A0ACB7YE78_9ERIC|nr:hypothetical protein Vadar_012137 [Vaccinium darrowii]
MSTQLEVNVAPKESIPAELAPAPLKINVPGELTTVSITKNITTVSVMTVSSEFTALTTGSVAPEVATLSKLGTPPEVAPLSKVDVPPEVTTESTVTVPPEVSPASTESVPLTETVESTESMPPEETSELTESVPPEATESTLLEETSKLTESVPLEETSKLTESVPPEVTESTPLEETSESKESVPPEATESTPLEETFELTESDSLEATESTPLEEISDLTETVLLEAAALSLTSAAQGFIGLFAKSTESAPSEVTSESTESVPPKLTVEPTDSAPSEVTNLSPVSAPTAVSSENIVPESTTMSSVSAQPPGLTATSKVQSVPPELTSKAREDAIQLHRAFEGWGCDAPTIVKVLAHRSATQRALIRREYKTKFSEDLDKRLSKELRLSADLKRAVLLWMHDSATRDAVLVRQGLTEKLTLKLNVAIEVICSRTPSQIEQLKKAYRPLFGSYLEQDIESHALGDNKKLLLAYVSKSRSEGTKVDATMVNKDANALFKDGEYKLGTNEETFIRIFSERSWAHLAAVNAAYRSMYVNSLRKAVKHETSWNFKCALLTILQCAENPAKYFAKVLHKAMDRLGTDEKTLSRIIVSRAEIDIQQIKAEYLKKYRKSLSDEVHSETSGNYRAFLLSLLDTNN